MKVRANGIQIEVEDTGEADRPAVLLIMGLGMQLVAWPDAFVQGLRDDGWRVVRFDNRDAGLSQPGGGPDGAVSLWPGHAAAHSRRPAHACARHGP